jgi:predicted alpha-1,2-mannosidase
MIPRIAVVAALLVPFAASGCGSDAADATTANDPPPVATDAGDGPAHWVVPFVGTADAHAPNPVTNGTMGSTFPGAAAPFGMVQWSPDTPTAGPPGYAFVDDTILGFSLTHLNGAGCTAMRDFPVMPVVGAWDGSADPTDGFSHDREVAWPGYYEVELDSGIRVDLTATQRAGLARFTFPSGAGGTVVLAGARQHEALVAKDFEATIRPDGVVLGSREDAFFCGTAPHYRTYFAMRLERAAAEIGTWSAGATSPGATTVQGDHAGVYARFDGAGGRVVEVKIGLSYVSADAALANLDAEMPSWDFEATRATTLARWNEMLGRIAVEGGADAQKQTFYTALYHSLVQPAVASDVNGDFVGFDGQKRNASGYVRYQNFSGWDVYRSWVELAAMIAPTETGDMMRSLVEAGDECGAMPKWSLANTETGVMVGDPADAILASAWAFGARGFDVAHALELANKGATDPSAACNGVRVRPGIVDYLARGYCPVDGADQPDGPASTTLEYAIADFAIAELAKDAGDDATAATFLARAKNWKNVFDPALVANGFSGYVAPRYLADQNGAPHFDETIDVSHTAYFVEGNPTQYTFMVPYDVAGLVSALGGDAATVARLDAFFEELNAGTQRPHAYMGNEPNFFTPWEYPWAGAPSRTQAVVKDIVAQLFTPKPDGLPGNDDLGATSSWAVWAMLGMYPIAPGVGGLVVGSPTFAKETIAAPGAAPIVITAARSAPDDAYVQSLAVDGADRTKAWIDWSEIAGGGSIDFTLASQPSATWGVSAADRPPSWLP